MTTSGSILYHFSSIEDPRVNRQKKHQLQDIFFITLCGVISGADNWVMIEQYGKSKEAWFTEQLDLKHGIPSHDTFGDVFAAIDTEQFSACFTNWVNDLASLSEGEIVAIDGKSIRRSLDKASNKAAIHMVSAWAHTNRLVPGQEKVDEKSNEITAIPKLLERLDITGSIVTIDAMGCQKTIAQQIIDNKADYVLSLKGNHADLHDDVITYFQSPAAPDALSVDVDAGHGRIETRQAQIIDQIDWLKQSHPNWSGLQSIIAVSATREFKDGSSDQETRYFLSSLNASDPARLARAVRAHWSIENSLHWVLDVAFDEDRNRTRQGYSAANLAIVRHIAVNLVKNEKSVKVGVKTKRAKAGWDNDYLLKVIGIV